MSVSRVGVVGFGFSGPALEAAAEPAAFGETLFELDILLSHLCYEPARTSPQLVTEVGVEISVKLDYLGNRRMEKMKDNNCSCIKSLP
jgi:hypothetical protein